MEAFAKWVQTYQAIIAVLLGVAGWIANHYFTLRAQNKNFQKQLYNTARIDITSAVRQYEEYLIELEDFCIKWVEITKSEKDEQGFPIDIFDYWDEKRWKIVMDEFDKINNKYNFKWKYSIEEYLTLIPIIMPNYDLLVERDKQIQKLSFMIKYDLNYMIENCCQDVGIILSGSIDEAEDKISYINKQICFVRELLVILQNICFSKITGNKIINKRM
ncbi:hypothetical protein [Anaerospora hongkongensis]|uniref:hypothetical protein n=1 Tax=Anaerospora hongkongensis TaxID=244830 RepID=UPI002896D427|nr:hypothetical protein [Anaerospora hongkongensis]